MLLFWDAAVRALRNQVLRTAVRRAHPGVGALVLLFCALPAFAQHPANASDGQHASGLRAPAAARARSGPLAGGPLAGLAAARAEQQVEIEGVVARFLRGRVRGPVAFDPRVRQRNGRRAVRRNLHHVRQIASQLGATRVASARRLMRCRKAGPGVSACRFAARTKRDTQAIVGMSIPTVKGGAALVHVDIWAPDGPSVHLVHHRVTYRLAQRHGTWAMVRHRPYGTARTSR